MINKRKPKNIVVSAELYEKLLILANPQFLSASQWVNKQIKEKYDELELEV